MADLLANYKPKTNKEPSERVPVDLLAGYKPKSPQLGELSYVESRKGMTAEQQKKEDWESIKKFGSSAGKAIKEDVSDILKLPENIKNIIASPTRTIGQIGDAISHGITSVGEILSKPEEALKKIDNYIREYDVEKAGSLAAHTAFGAGAGRAAKEVAGSIGEFVKASKGTEAERATAAVEKMLPEEVKHHKIAARNAGLPESEGPATPAGGDLESKVKTVASQKLRGAIKQRAEQAKEVWDKYRNRGLALENNGEFFTVSPYGHQVIEDLSEIEKGTKGGKTIYSEGTRKMARDLREALSGIQEDGVRAPVDINLVDEQLQILRERQFNTGSEGVSAIERKKLKELADKLENGLEAWVGKDVYPRKIYAEASKDINKWSTKLGQALTGRQDVEYLTESMSPEEYQSKILKKVFSGRSNVSEARKLLGEEEFRPMAEQYLSNSLRRKTSKQAIDWYEKNDWIKDVPEANKKALDYIRVLGEREGRAESLKWVKQKAKFGAAALATGALAGEGFSLYKDNR